jgi:hypothetical protein
VYLTELQAPRYARVVAPETEKGYRAEDNLGPAARSWTLQHSPMFPGQLVREVFLTVTIRDAFWRSLFSRLYGSLNS